jgi:hypothetical protein
MHFRSTPSSQPSSNKEGELGEHQPFGIKKILSGVRTVASGIMHGIPVELAFIVTPEKKKEILGEFYARTKTMPRIADQVRVMLELLDKNFPDLEEHSIRWLSVRSHFFGCVGLWGKAG